MTNSELLQAAIEAGLVIGYADIETSPHLLWGYGLFDQHFSIDQIKEPGKITSVAYLIEGQDEPKALSWEFNKKTKTGCDKKLLIEFSKALKKIDLFIGQNSNSFDLKWINWRLNIHNLPPVINSVTLDTLKLSKRVFRPPTHKLDYRSRAYNLGGKIDQSMKQIIAVAEGNKREQEERIRYNKKDVLDTRSVFWKELDYYVLPKKIERLLHQFIAREIIVCKLCESHHQSKFEVSKMRIRGATTCSCNRCGASWEIIK